MEYLRQLSSAFVNSCRNPNDEKHMMGKWVSQFPESQDYEFVESIEWRKYELRQFAEDDGKWLNRKRKFILLNWFLVTIVGILCGIIGFAVHTSTYGLLSMKTAHTSVYLSNGRWAEAFMVHFAFGFAFSLLAFMFVFFDIHAAGSGLPEVKSYLNGINLEKIVKIKTLFCKASSVIFTVASGLFAGPEGPMVHIGAIIGATASRTYNQIIAFDRHWSEFNVFRTDSITRDFVTFGVAGGVTAAFRAPIGGVLFSLEEGASFWSTSVTWQAFFCTSVTLITVIVIDRAVHYDGVNTSSNFSFGKFSEVMNKDKSDYFLYELPLFFLMGCLGGILGAIFVKFNLLLSYARIRFIGDARWKRFIEIVMVCTITIWSTFTVPLMWRVCSNIPEKLDSFSKQEKELIDQLIQFDCPLGQYNQVASLLYVDSNTAIKQLLHFREHMSAETFSGGSLLVFFIPHFILYCATCGVMASAGVFVPSLLSGACMGRIVGHLMNSFFPGAVSDSGTYALIGAAAMLGGVCRMTISLTVILVEVTGNLQYVLPLMLTLLASRYTGNAFSPGLYDQIVKLKRLPYLEESLNAIGLIDTCPVSEFMSKPVVVLKELERVGNVFQALSATTFNSFPVLDSEGRLKGACSRNTLCCMLQARCFSVPLQERASGSREIEVVPIPEKYEDPWTLEDNWINVRQLPTIETISITEDDTKYWLDLRRHMDTAPHTILENTSVKRAYRMFRTMGLRHLIVIDGNCKVSGMLTRKDLSEERLHSWYLAYGQSHRGKGLDLIYGLEQLSPLFVKVDEDGEVVDEFTPLQQEFGSSPTNTTVVRKSSTSREILKLDEVLGVEGVGVGVGITSPSRLRRDILISNTINNINRNNMNNSHNFIQEETSDHSVRSVTTTMSNYYGRNTVIRWADEEGIALERSMHSNHARNKPEIKLPMETL